MKVVSIVGARPQFIKCAPVSRELRRVASEIVVHTGQHYDGNMSDVFFRDLDLPKPDFYLGIGSGSHAKQTGPMLEKIEEVLLQETPDYCLVYGDTNSTLAGALAAAKLHIPVAHVEAGLRSFNRQMPEEINRVVTDHLSSVLFCPTETAVKNLSQEGITRGVHLIGDVMYDALWDNLQVAEKKSDILARLQLQPGNYILATVHRAENTDQPENLKNILYAFRELVKAGSTVVFPAHPRTQKQLGEFGKEKLANLHVIDPVSYLDMLLLESRARVILTDSGGVQKEACWLHVPCVTLRNETEWIETVESGWNVLVGPDPNRIVKAARCAEGGDPSHGPWQKGEATRNIVAVMGS
ncbi:MAG: UDP-N-acetylglucosamine 2-epimerase (non-hydrolyzing) [Nitrospirae bacterium]|nr:UDP-N-acetylglucosamine 2-epimerase (non-hydrolyzing) [Nitrospirota bacterium]